MSDQEVIEGLNIYRAVETCGERVMRTWADTTEDDEIREGFAAIAEREANHARALAERILALGGQPGPSCVDDALAQFVAQAEETTETRARFESFNALVKGTGETAEVLAVCGQGIRTAFDQGDPETQTMLQAILADEKLSMDWCAAHSSDQSAAATHASSADAS